MKLKRNLDHTAPPGALITTEALAKLIGYHPESVRRAIREGRIRALTFGHSHRIPPDEVSNILQKGLPMARP